MTDAADKDAAPDDALKVSAAQNWIMREAGYEATWRTHGVINFPSASFFMGAPLTENGAEAASPMRPPLPMFRVMTYGANQIGPNGMVWLEGNGAAPARLGPCYTVSLDQGVLAIGDMGASRALASLPEDVAQMALKTQHRGPHFVSFLDVPNGAGRILFVSGAEREQVIAATLLDDEGATTGILIDFVGRALDGEHSAISLAELT